MERSLRVRAVLHKPNRGLAATNVGRLRRSPPRRQVRARAEACLLAVPTTGLRNPQVAEFVGKLATAARFCKEARHLIRPRTAWFLLQRASRQKRVWLGANKRYGALGAILLEPGRPSVTTMSCHVIRWLEPRAARVHHPRNRDSS